MHIHMYYIYKETVTARWYGRKHYKKEVRKTISGYTLKSVIVCCVITVYCVYTVPHGQHVFLCGAAHLASNLR